MASAGRSSTGKTPMETVEKELYFLIARLLAGGPCQKSAEILQRELEELNLLPARTDINGKPHARTFEEFAKLHHLPPDYLLKICSGVGPLLDGIKPPSVPGLELSLLGRGKQSLIRHTKGPTYWNHHSYAAVKNSTSLVPPNDITRSFPINQLLAGREICGVASKRLVLSESFVSNRLHLTCRIFGHLSSVFCVTFDRTGQFIFTGADDNLIKVWSANEGRLLYTFRGCFGEITDFSVNHENTLLAAGSCDKLIRVWSLKNGAQIAVLCGHTAFITSVQFLPHASDSSVRYLVSTSNDGSICFWRWDAETRHFDPIPVRFIERVRSNNQIICVSYSPGGRFLAAGCSDNFVRLYRINSADQPEKMQEMEGHSDRVDSVSWSNRGLKFVTGSKDGTARLWTFERQEWTSKLLAITPLTTQKPNETTRATDSQTTSKPPKLKVTMVAWSSDDAFVVVSATDFALRVFDSCTSNLIHILIGHTDESFVLESSQVNPRVMLSAGHDGCIFLWDIVTGRQLKKHFNAIDGFGHGAFFDGKMSPDSCTIAAVDSHGQLSILSASANDKVKNVPKEQFFHTDYRPLVRDLNFFVIDEQTQMAPNLMPPPFLVTSDGSPYPAAIQRLVPGREKCSDAYLEPQLVLRNDDQNVVVEVVEPGSTDDDTSQDSVVKRRDPVDPSQGPYCCWTSRAIVRQLDGATMTRIRQTRESLGQMETEIYQLELTRSPIVAQPEVSPNKTHMRRRKRSTVNHGYGTRTSRQPTSVYASEELVSAPPISSSDSDDSDYTRTSASSVSGSDTDSGQERSESDNSDWEEENGHSRTARARQPPTEQPETTEKSRRVRRRLRNQSSDDDNSDTEQKPPANDFSCISDIVDSEELAADHAGSSQDPVVKTEPAKKSMNKSLRKKTKSLPITRDPLRSPDDVPESQRFPEWLTTTFPKKSPFFPQIRDEVVYFFQGHQMYVKAVREMGLYEIDDRSLPWLKHGMKTEMFCRVVDLKYILFPHRLCHIKLQPFNSISGEKTGSSFVVKYHDMANVVDFIVLKAHYDLAITKNWQSGDPFRAVIDDKWYFGTVESLEPLDSDLPESKFQSIKVRWDTNDVEPMSFWDLEPLGDSKPPTKDSSIDLTCDDFRTLSLCYEARPSDWSDNNRDEEIIRIIDGIKCLSQFACAESFSFPVDLDMYPEYQMTIEYPIDLNTIKSRLENQFYRRVAAVVFDVEYIFYNAKRFNQRGSVIIRQAKLITDVLKKFLNDPSCADITSVYNELNTRSDEPIPGAEDSDEVSLESTPHVSKKKIKRHKNMESAYRSSKSSGSGYNTRKTEKSWKEGCREILDALINSDDAEPFKRDSMNHQGTSGDDQNDMPLDLETIGEKLQSGDYNTPADFNNDLMSMFRQSQTTSSRTERKKGFSMVLRLKARYTQLITPLLNGNSSRSSSSNQMHKRDHEYNTRQSHRPTTITTVRPRLASDLDVAVSLGATSSYQGRANRPKKVLAIKVKNEGRRTNVIASDSSDNLVPISQRTAPKNTKSQSPDIPLNDSPTLSGDRTCRIRRSAASRPVKYTEESSDEEFSPVVPEVQTDENVDDENFNGESSSEEDEDEDEDEEKLLKTRKNRPQPEVKEAPRARVKRHLESSEEEDEEEEENMSEYEEPEENSDDSNFEVGNGKKRKAIGREQKNKNEKRVPRATVKRQKPGTSATAKKGQMETRFRGRKIPTSYCELSSEEEDEDDVWSGNSQPTCSSRGRIIKRKKYT